MYSPSCTTFPLKPYRNIINVFKGPTANVKKTLIGKSYVYFAIDIHLTLDEIFLLIQSIMDHVNFILLGYNCQNLDIQD